MNKTERESGVAHNQKRSEAPLCHLKRTPICSTHTQYAPEMNQADVPTGLPLEFAVKGSSRTYTSAMRCAPSASWMEAPVECVGHPTVGVAVPAKGKGAVRRPRSMLLA